MGTKPQTPSTPGNLGPEPFFDAEQASHVPAHALLQQTPSTQKVDAHSFPLRQIAPFGCCRTQAPCGLQWSPRGQAESVHTMHVPFTHKGVLPEQGVPKVTQPAFAVHSCGCCPLH